jgi:glycine dehydrogenase
MDKFSSRHIGINNIQKEEMLDCLGLNSMEQLISETIPKNIRLKRELDLDDELSENEFLTHIDKLSKKK